MLISRMRIISASILFLSVGFFSWGSGVHAVYTDIPHAALTSVNIATNSTTAGATTVSAGTGVISAAADTWQMVKESGLDVFANVTKRTIIRSIVQDSVNWINNGFEGEPSWGQSLTNVLEDNTNRLVDNFLYSNQYTKGLCKGFDLPLKFAIQLKFYEKSRFSAGGDRYTPKCTIESAENSIKDIEDFYKNDVVSYSWDNFLDTTTNTDNNPFGVYFNLSDDLEKQIERRTKKTEQELNSNSGFLSYRKCDESGWRAAETAISGQDNAGKNYGSYDGSDMSESFCQITTPGTQIARTLESSMNAGLDQLVTADEFDEIIGALVGQLVRGVISGGLAKATSYEEYTDPGLEKFKGLIEENRKRYINDLDPRRYKVAIKIQENSIELLKKSQKRHQEVKACWANKSDMTELDSEKKLEQYSDSSEISKKEIDFYSNNKYNSSFKQLNSETVFGAMNTLNVLESMLDYKVLKLEKSVDGLKDAREENIDKISKLHTASEQEVSEILLRFTGNSSSVDIIFNEEQKRRVLEKQINQIFSGAATDPVETEPVNIDDGTGGEMIKVGGIGRSLVYCGSFQKVDSIVPYDAVVEILPEVNINLLKSSDSIEPIWLKSDSSYYNSFADEQEIKETEYFEIFSEKLSGKDMEEAERFSVERVPKGACVSKDGLFVKNSNVSGSLDYKTGEACRKVFAATCRDSKFIHQFLPRGDDYPSEFWMKRTDQRGTELACGEVVDKSNEYYKSCSFAGGVIKNKEFASGWYKSMVDDRYICSKKEAYCNLGTLENYKNSSEKLRKDFLFDSKEGCMNN